MHDPITHTFLVGPTRNPNMGQATNKKAEIKIDFTNSANEQKDQTNSWVPSSITKPQPTFARVKV